MEVTIMKYQYKTQGVCSQYIAFDIEDNVVSNITFLGGCSGNLQAISKLLEGMTVEYIEEKLKGNSCGGRPTSCADQLALALSEALGQQ